MWTKQGHGGAGHREVTVAFTDNPNYEKESQW